MHAAERRICAHPPDALVGRASCVLQYGLVEGYIVFIVIVIGAYKALYTHQGYRNPLHQLSPLEEKRNVILQGRRDKGLVRIE